MWQKMLNRISCWIGEPGEPFGVWKPHRALPGQSGVDIGYGAPPELEWVCEAKIPWDVLKRPVLNILRGQEDCARGWLAPARSARGILSQ